MANDEQQAPEDPIELRVEQARFEHEKTLMHLKSASDSGLAAARGIFLFSGAAIVAMLTYLGTGPGAEHLKNDHTLKALAYFILGLFLAVLCHGAGSDAHKNRAYGKTPLINDIGTKLFWFGSLISAVAGAFQAAMTFGFQFPGCPAYLPAIFC